MSSKFFNPPRFAVIGGGISGLSAAYRLRQLLPDSQVEIFEASDRLGGVLSTRQDGNYLIERGSDSFITKQPWAADLCHELGLGKDLIPTNPTHRRALVLKGKELHPVPEGFVLIRPTRVMPILRTSLLSWRAKLRVLAERWKTLPPDIHSPDFDDNLAHFASERLGREAFQRLVEPLVAGIYTADANRLSVAATIPEILECLRRHGTLWHRDNDKTDKSSGARYASFMTLRCGVGQLVEALASRLSTDRVHLNRRISSLSRDQQSAWLVRDDGGTMLGPFLGVVVAVPAPKASSLLGDVDSGLASMLGRISYASSAVVNLAFEKNQIARLPDGFGIVVPRIENRPIVAASFSSVKFPGRATDAAALVRVFLGGSRRPEMVELSDQQLSDIALTELREILKIQGDPQLVDVTRWREKMPQFHVGHVKLVTEIDARASRISGLALAGNAYHGVGIPYCVRSGELAARKLLQELANDSALS